jgi:fluoride exporter
VIILAVLVGGMIGAPARYLTDRFVQARRDTVFPWGTFAVNMAGSAVVGFLLGAQRHLGLPPVVFALLATGFCGGLTTFSTFGYETLRLLEDGAVTDAGLNVIGSLAAGILLAWVGFRIATVLLFRFVSAPYAARPAAGFRREPSPIPRSELTGGHT